MGDSTSAASQEAQGDLSPSSHQPEAEETTTPSEQTTEAQADHVVSELVVKQVAPSPVITPLLEEGEPVKELRYANPHGTFITGIDVQSEEAALKRSQRAERFGLSKDEAEEGVADVESVERREARAKRFGTKVVAYKGEPVKLVDKLPEIPGGDVRLEVLYLHGTDEMSTKDIFNYFQSYAPRNIEWINDSSCNVVWEDAESAYRALHGSTSQPIALSSEYTEDQPMEVGGSIETGGGANVEIAGPHWRLGVECPRAKQLLLRYAVSGDQKLSGAAQWSNYYRKYGNPNQKGRAMAHQFSGSGRPGHGGTANTWRDMVPSKEAQEEKPVSVKTKTWRDKPVVQDLRQRLGKRERKSDEDENMNTSEKQLDPLDLLVKRPKPLYCERLVDEVEEGSFKDQSEKERAVKVTEITGSDLRRKLQKNRRKRDLKLRLGHNPRLVEKTL